ncbi:MAG TPA: GNAT family N-acetyltransferase [Candidatus Cloacimonadota bacterium]|nr:GNAT family N-acetyltransferase [Candidatus Cloacimonadota bacterium]HPT70891.1 GNAT family N-acetyltransferase [Candidatus Cloacimonadota bacterium]
MIKIIRKPYINLTQEDLKNIEKINADFGGLIFHEVQFNVIVKETFRTELFYWLAISNEGKLIGFCPMHTEKRGLLKYTFSSPSHLGVPYGGWIFDSSQVSHDELIKGMKLSFNEISLYFSSIQYPSDTLSQTQLPMKRLATPIIDLSQSEEDIWSKSLKYARRNRIRKAQKEGVVLKIYGVEGFDKFYPCMQDLHKRINVPVKPEAYYRKILDYYAPRNQARLFITEKDGEVLSGGLVVGNQKFMHGWEAGIRENAPSIGLNETMYWEIIVWAKQIGTSFVDFCVIDEVNLPNIAFFKLEFTRLVVPFYHIVRSSLSSKIISKLQKRLGK